MKQIMSEQVFRGMRQDFVQSTEEAPRPIVANQTYLHPLTELVIEALGDVEPYMRGSVESEDVPSTYAQCRKKLLNANLAAVALNGDLVIDNDGDSVLLGARPRYLKALRNALVSLRESFEDCSRLNRVTPREISRLCQDVMEDVMIGKKADVIFDSSLVYAEPDLASHIDRAERRYHGVKRD